MGAAIAGYFVLRQIETATENIQKQLTVTIDGQITDRFSRAIDHLASEQPAIRRGGIYELNRIATDSDKDRIAVIETLSSFIRENAPAPLAAAHRSVPSVLPSLRSDIQAALTVIVQHNRASPGHIDLSRTDLAKADLIGANLRDAILDGVWLEGAYLNGAILDGASLQTAHLAFADLERASFLRTDLAAADFESALLKGADLSGAHGLQSDTLSHAQTDAKTKLPIYISAATVAALSSDGRPGNR